MSVGLDEGIHWVVCDQDALCQIKALGYAQTVKENDVRRVFYVAEASTASPEYFIKVIKPERGLRALKRFFRNKVRGEFRSYELLKAAGIPVVRYCGYGFRGAYGYLISEALSGYVELSDYLLRHSEDLFLIGKLMDQVASLMIEMLEAGLYHPDFHFGNVMVREVDGGLDYQLLDVYGVRQTKISSEHIFEMAQVMVSSLWRVDGAVSEAIFARFAKVSGLALAAFKSGLYGHWRNKMVEKYNKRVKKFFKESSFCHIHNENEAVWYLSELSHAVPDETLKRITDGDECFGVEEFSSVEEGKQLWKRVFCAYQYGLPTVNYLALSVAKDQSAAVYFELPDGACSLVEAIHEAETTARATKLYNDFIAQLKAAQLYTAAIDQNSFLYVQEKGRSRLVFSDLGGLKMK